MKFFSVIVILIVLSACNNKDEKAKNDAPQGPLTKTANSEVFNQSFSQLMTDYYHLKDNFITESDTNINAYARKMIHDADSLPVKELHADTAIIATAKSFMEGISGELNGLIAEKNIEEKRKSFQMLSLELFDLIRTVQYDKEVIYMQHCAQAMNNQGADWLSNLSDIRNPYEPKKMLTCGELKDSVNFKKK